MDGWDEQLTRASVCDCRLLRCAVRRALAVAPLHSLLHITVLHCITLCELLSLQTLSARTQPAAGGCSGHGERQ